MYVIKARTHVCVWNDSETHSTGVTGLHSQLRRSCNPVTQSRVFHCHFAHTRAFSLYTRTNYGLTHICHSASMCYPKYLSLIISALDKSQIFLLIWQTRFCFFKINYKKCMVKCMNWFYFPIYWAMGYGKLHSIGWPNNGWNSSGN